MSHYHNSSSSAAADASHRRRHHHHNNNNASTTTTTSSSSSSSRSHNHTNNNNTTPQDLYTEPFQPLQNHKSNVMKYKERYLKERKLHQLRQQVQERLMRERDMMHLGASSSAATGGGDGDSAASSDGNDASNGATGSNHHNNPTSPEIDTTKILGEITYSLEQKLRHSIKQEIHQEQQLESRQKQMKYAQMDSYLAEEIASKICAVCFELMRAPEHSPMILFPCGHTFCSDCVKCLLKQSHAGKKVCPECRAPIKSHAVNMPLKQIIESYVEKDREMKQKKREREEQQEQDRRNRKHHHGSSGSRTQQQQQHNLEIENKMDSVMETILNDLSHQDMQTAKKYYTDYKKFSLRSQLLNLELKEVRDDLKSLDKKEHKTRKRVQSVEKEEEAIRKDIEMLMQGLEELQQQLTQYRDDERQIQQQRKESAKKEELIHNTIQSVESQKEKSIVLLQKFVPHARRLQFE